MGSDQGILKGEDPGLNLPGCADVWPCLRQGTGDLSSRGGGHRKPVSGHYTTTCCVREPSGLRLLCGNLTLTRSAVKQSSSVKTGFPEAVGSPPLSLLRARLLCLSDRD